MLKNFSDFLNENSNADFLPLNEENITYHSELDIYDAKFISKELSKLLGFRVSIKNNKLDVNGRFATIYTTNITPNECGILGPMIVSGTLNIKAAKISGDDMMVSNMDSVNGTAIFLDLSYSYKHPSGSNGYDVRLYSVNGGPFVY